MAKMTKEQKREQMIAESREREATQYQAWLAEERTKIVVTSVDGFFGLRDKLDADLRVTLWRTATTYEDAMRNLRHALRAATEEIADMERNLAEGRIYSSNNVGRRAEDVTTYSTIARTVRESLGMIAQAANVYYAPLDTPYQAEQRAKLLATEPFWYLTEWRLRTGDELRPEAYASRTEAVLALKALAGRL